MLLWPPALQIFFACMCATLTLNLSRSAGKALIHSGSFGWFNQVGGVGVVYVCGRYQLLASLGWVCFAPAPHSSSCE